MKQIKLAVSAILLITCQFACRQLQQQQNSSHQVKVIEAKGYTVAAGSTLPPAMIPVSESDFKTIALSGVQPVSTNANVHDAITPLPIAATDPVVCMPGKDSFLMPVTSAVIDSQINVGPAEVLIAKDMAIKDPNPANFSYFGKLQGMRHISVQCLIQDKAGNIWMGTRGGGLSKYDGQSFTHFSKIEALASNRVNSLLEDRSGNIWFGSERGGVFKYDGKKFMYLRDEKGMFNNYVVSILQDQKGNIWFGTRRGGVSKYDGKSFTHFTTKQGLSNNYVNCIYEDKKGNIWVGTKGGGVNKFNGESFSRYTTKQGLSGNTILSILEDRHGDIWFATDSNGVNRFDGHFIYQYTVKEGLSSNHTTTLLEVVSGNIWLGTDGMGAMKYDGKQFSHYTDKEGFPNKTVISMLQDRSGNIWFGNYGSLTKLNGLPFSHITDKEGLLFNQNWSILEDKKRNIWFGSQAGLCKYDGKQFTSYTQKNGLPQSTTVRSLAEDHNGNLWIGFGGGGFCKFDGKVFKYFEDKINSPASSVQDIMEDSHGNMWFANSEGGIYKYDGKYITHFTTKQGMSSNWANTLLEDKKGNIWIGTSTGGVIKYDGKQFTNFTEKDGFIHKGVWAGIEDQSGNLWFGTEGGVARYDGKYFTYFTEKEGMLNNYALAINEDHEGNLWFGTRVGLNKLPKSNVIKSYLETKANEEGIDENQNLFMEYGYADGFLGLGGQSGETILTDHNGNIWACSNDRVTIYHSSTENKSAEPTKTRLTGLSLFNEMVDWNALVKNKDSSFLLANGVRVGNIRFDSTVKWHNLPANLSLAYDNNYLTFNFIGITMYQPGKVKYRYMLEGNDKNWSGLTNNNRASYGNLSPGKYTFKVKSINSYAKWSNEYTYSFTIRPPWWFSWWAYCIYGLLIAATAFWFHNYQRRRFIMAEKMKAEKKELEQAKLIERAYTELAQTHENLKSTQSQLIQSEKMASLGELTAGIAHEIQNPLNFVNNFSEVNKELLLEMKEEIDKGNLDEAKSIANDVIDNEQKIIHHGKRADAIVKGMLQHSRSSNGLKEPTDINALTDEYLRLAYHGLRAKDKTFNATLKTDFDETVGNINIIPQDIGRVILNIITNAFYVVDEKKKNGIDNYEPTVSVSTKKVADKVEIKVADNGNGIPQKVLDKIFQPFFTTKPTGQGTGLGLSLSYDIVKAHGGELKVETNEGEGTEFIIVLPANN